MLAGGKSMPDVLMPRFTGACYHFCHNQYVKENHEVNSDSGIEQYTQTLNKIIYKFIGKNILVNTMEQITSVIVQTAYHK